MPVILPFSAFIASLGSLMYLIKRRLSLIKKTLTLQDELEESQRLLERAEKKQVIQKEKAIKELKIATEQKHKALRNLGAINDLLKKAENELAMANDEEALRTLIQVTALDENHRKGNEHLAGLYFKLGQYKKADLLYKKLIDLHPFDPNYVSALGQCYFACHQFKAAIKCHEKALSLDKVNPMRYVNLGNVYGAKKEYSVALEYFMKAQKLDVRNIELMFLIIEMCLQNSNPITAREYLHKILDYEPYNQQAKSLLGEVLRMLQE